MQIGEPHRHRRHLTTISASVPYLNFLTQHGESGWGAVAAGRPRGHTRNKHSRRAAPQNKWDGRIRCASDVAASCGRGNRLHEGTGAQQRVEREVLQPDYPY